MHTCPDCGHRFSLFDANEVECSRELHKLSASMPESIWRDIVPYLWLFKPRQRSLRMSRGLALAEEVLVLSDCDTQVLSAALRETVSTFTKKRALGNWKPLKNHNYLRAVIDTERQREDGKGRDIVPAQDGQKPASKTGQSIDALQEFGNE